MAIYTGKRKPLRLGQPFVENFIPLGRTETVIYLVVVNAHPTFVKIGRTRGWVTRRKAYASWNLSAGNGILSERVFRLTEEYVDLEKLEKDLIATMPFAKAYGNEWFIAEIDEMGRLVDRFLCAHDISYI